MMRLAGSASRSRDRKREAAFLKSWLKSLENVTVDLVAFRNDADAPVSFAIKKMVMYQDLLKWPLRLFRSTEALRWARIDIAAIPDAGHSWC